MMFILFLLLFVQQPTVAVLTPENRFFTVPSAPLTATQIVIKTEILIQKDYQLGVLGDNNTLGIVTFNAGNSFESRGIYVRNSTTPISGAICTIPAVQMFHYPDDGIDGVISGNSTTGNITIRTIDINPLDFQGNTIFGCRFESQYATIYTSGYVATRERKVQNTVVTVSFQ